LKKSAPPESGGVYSPSTWRVPKNNVGVQAHTCRKFQSPFKLHLIQTLNYTQYTNFNELKMLTITQEFKRRLELSTGVGASPQGGSLQPECFTGFRNNVGV